MAKYLGFGYAVIKESHKQGLWKQMNWLPCQRDFGQLQSVCSGSSGGENYHPQPYLSLHLEVDFVLIPAFLCALLSVGYEDKGEWVEGRLKKIKHFIVRKQCRNKLKYISNKDQQGNLRRARLP